MTLLCQFTNCVRAIVKNSHVSVKVNLKFTITLTLMMNLSFKLNLSNLSDLISEADLKSELSGESYLDWDVVDEMVAMLSNRELSTPSTLNS